MKINSESQRKTSTMKFLNLFDFLVVLHSFLLESRKAEISDRLRYGTVSLGWSFLTFRVSWLSSTSIKEIFLVPSRWIQYGISKRREPGT